RRAARRPGADRHAQLLPRARPVRPGPPAPAGAAAAVVRGGPALLHRVPAGHGADPVRGPHGPHRRAPGDHGTVGGGRRAHPDVPAPGRALGAGPGGGCGMTLVRRLLDQAAATPDAVALVAGNGAQLTYGDLRRRVLAVRPGLLEAGRAPGAGVVFSVPPSP